MPISLVLADDHPIVLEGLGELFGREKDLQVLAKCRTGRETLQAVRAHRPDVLVLDIRMPEMDGLAVLRAIRQEKLAARVVVLTAAVDEAEVLECMRLGVQGVVLKEMALDSLVQCVRKVHGGEQWLERRSTARLLEKLLRREAGEHSVAEVLTPREIQVVRMVALGRRNKEIARDLSIEEGTVKIHLHNIYEKLKLDGRVALTLFAQDKGLA